jgi:hypothetical protein
MAESEPFWGLGVGYHNAYGRSALGALPYAHFNPIARQAPFAQYARVSAVPAPAPYVRQAPLEQYAPVAAVPAASPYVSTVATKAVPSAPSTMQFHSQDEMGNYEYGYDNQNSAKHEVGNTNIGVSGSYTTKDLYGARTVHYVADGLGFRLTPAHLRN